METYNIQEQGSFTDKESILRQIDPKATIEDLKLHFLGLKRESYKDGTVMRTKVVRISKPMFTYEFVQNQLMLILNAKLNYVVQVSRFTEDEILRRIMADDKRLCLTLAEGCKHYITDAQWNKILELEDNKAPLKDLNDEWVVNDRGEPKLFSYWQRNGFNWDYNKPVDNKMQEMTKISSNTSSSMFAVLSQIRSAITSLTFASYNKSFADNFNQNGMLVGMLGEMKKETSVLRDSDNKKKSWLSQQEG
jgi:hypothetical protein